MKMAKLKCCPFCGHEGTLRAMRFGREKEFRFAVTCPVCEIAIGWEFSEEKAVDRWNTRVEETPPRQQWISVEDKLPDSDGEYLVLHEDGSMFTTTYDSCVDEPDERWGCWKEYFSSETLGSLGSDWLPIFGITHWMPIPVLPEKDGVFACVMCGDTFTEADLKELDDMGERYHREDGCFLCPDCWDSFQRMDPEEQAKMAIMNGWKEARHGPEHED